MSRTHRSTQKVMDGQVLGTGADHVSEIALSSEAPPRDAITSVVVDAGVDGIIVVVEGAYDPLGDWFVLAYLVSGAPPTAVPGQDGVNLFNRTTFYAATPAYPHMRYTINDPGLAGDTADGWISG